MHRKNHPWKFYFRLLVFLTIFVFMALGPFYRQVLGGRSPIFRNWVMFNGLALNLVEARFFQRLSSGKENKIDRSEILGLKKDSPAARNLKKIIGTKRLNQIAALLCSKLEQPKDLRIQARLSTRRGWRRLYAKETNFCKTLGFNQSFEIQHN